MILFQYHLKGIECKELIDELISSNFEEGQRATEQIALELEPMVAIAKDQAVFVEE